MDAIRSAAIAAMAVLLTATATPAASTLSGLAAVPGTASPISAVDTLGLFDPATATWYLRDSIGRTSAFEFGTVGATPVMGDWDGDGFDSPGTYDPATGTLLLTDDPATEDSAVVTILSQGGLPVVVDHDGDGRDVVALIVDGNLAGDWGHPTDIPDEFIATIATDVDGDGRDDLVVCTEGGWVAGGTPVALPPVAAGDRPVIGDWNGDGVETLAAFRPRNAEFWVYGGPTVGHGVSIMLFGSSRMLPVAGRFGMPHGDPSSPPRIIEIPPLARGDSGGSVARLQTGLTAAGLYRGEIDGLYGSEVEHAVMALHKAAGRERTWDWAEGDTDLLATFEPAGYPIRPGEPDRLEVDVGRQVMFVIKNHQVESIVSVSTGGGYTYYSERSHRNVRATTPRGDFELLRYSKGRSCDPLYGWCIYNAWNFTTYYAIHGYREVPAYPVSHGCVRIPNWEADALEADFYVGMPVHVWDEMPIIPIWIDHFPAVTTGLPGVS